MAHSVVELTVVLANLTSGGRHGEPYARLGATSRVAALELLIGRRPYVGSRAGLTEDRGPHNGGCGDVPSIWIPTVLGMTLQCLGWRHSGGDGHTGPEVIGKTFPAGLTSWRRPRQACSRWSYPFRGCRSHLSRGRREGGTGVGGTVSRNDTGLPAQYPHSTGDGHTVRVGRTAPGMIPRRCERAGVAGIRP
jgi:hypothetical protein